MKPFRGKVALVTGASSGIGKATALLFAERGATVVLAARREEALSDLVEEIENIGGKASAVVTDVTETRSVDAMVAHVIETHGRLDFAVNNAGIGEEVHMVAEMSDEWWDRVMDTNLRGNFLCLRAEAKAMLGTGSGGAIVNVGSVSGFLGCPGASAYSASKSGQIGLTTSSSAELAPQGIRVNLVCPGVIETPLHESIKQNIGAEVFEGVRQQTHLRRFGQPIEIARCIAFLCSDDASFVTGTTLTPDGGFHLTL